MTNLHTELREILTNWMSGEFPEMHVEAEILDLFTHLISEAKPEDKRSCYMGEKHEWEVSPMVLDSLPPTCSAQCKKCLLDKTYSENTEEYNACRSFNSALDTYEQRLLSIVRGDT